MSTYLLNDQCNTAVRARIRQEHDLDGMFIILEVGGALSSANGLSDVRTGFSPHSVRKSPDRRYRTNSQNPPVCVGQPTNSMNKNTTTYPRARQHIQAAAFRDMLIQCVLLRALKQTPGGFSQYDGSHPPQTLSQIQLHRGPPTPIYSTEELQQIAFESALSLFCIPAKPRPTFRIGGYERETAGLSAEEWSLAACT